jgi:hypothetical protein
VDSLRHNFYFSQTQHRKQVLKFDSAQLTNMTDTHHKSSMPQQEEAPASPLNVKEQLEATASRFWTSVTMANNKNNNNNNNNGATNNNDAPGIPMGLFTKKSFGSAQDAQKNGHGPCHVTQANSLKLVLNTMFSSCTTGGDDNAHFETDSHCDGSTVPSLLQHASHSRTAVTTALTPTHSSSFSSRGETSAPAPVTPSPLHKHQHQPNQTQSQHQKHVAAVKTLFRNNHDIAQEAIHRLRQQHQRHQIEKVIIANNSLYNESSEVAVDTERDHSVFSHSILSKNPSLLSTNAPSTLSMGPSTLASYNRTVSSSLLEPGQAQAQAKQPQHHPSQSRKSSLQKLISNRSVKKTAKMAMETTPVRTAAQKELHSFFPVSKPQDLLGKPTTSEEQKQRLKKKLRRNKGVPKEVATPSSTMRRTLKNRNTQRQKQILNGGNHGDDVFFGTDTDASRDANDSWDMDDDGISAITQTTVDRVVLAISKHLRVFPEEAETLNRVHSDVTDPAPKRGATKKKIHTCDNSSNTNTASSDQLVPMIGADVAGFSRIVTPPRLYSPVKKGMSPGLLTRNIGSVGTRSFFTKTTQSTQSQDFADAWKIDEQRFWDTEVAKEFDKFKNNGNSNHHGVAKKCPQSPGQMMVFKHKQTKQRYGTAHTTASTITTAKSSQTASFGSPQSPLSLFHQQQQEQHNFEEHLSREVFLSEHDLLMDSIVLQNAAEMAEI